MRYVLSATLCLLVLISSSIPRSYASQVPPISPAPELLTRAQSGDIQAQLDLADFYSAPEHYDAIAMYTWFLKAARAGSLKAQATVGFLVLEGIGTPSHPPTALLWLEVAAEQQDTESQLILASVYLNGSHGVQRDLQSAFRYFQQAAKSKNAQAQLMLAICYENGLGCERNPELALSYAAKSAALLNPQALCMMGDLSRKNVPHGTKLDHVTAMKPVDPIARAYYLHAAFLGQAKASYELAMAALKESGKNRMQDSSAKKQAIVSLFEHAAMEGYALAMYELALCYAYGYGVEQDEAYAASLFSDAASEGCAAARYVMAYLHVVGSGVKYSPRQAYEWILE